MYYESSLFLGEGSFDLNILSTLRFSEGFQQCVFPILFIGFGVLGGKFLEGIARQPELGGMLMGRMFLVAALVDAFAAVSIAMGLILLYAGNPLVTAAMNVVQ